MKIKSFTEYIVKESFDNELFLIHTTTTEIAEKIQSNVFIPNPFIQFNYYSEMGKDGIYFYDNLRQAQMYAYFLKSKIKCEKVALIRVKAPSWIVQKNDKLEDGFFIPTEYLNKIEILYITFEKPSDIY